MRWKKVSLIGVGLLGGSIGLAIRERGLAETVFGFVRRSASVRECQRRGVVHQATRDLAYAVQDADLIVLCTPIAQMKPLVQQMAGKLTPGTIITDVGSVKGSVVRELEPIAAKAGAHFIGSHPMAGAEKMGVSAARKDLFVGAICVITPTRNSHRRAVSRVSSFWKKAGARVIQMRPDSHDELVSRSSHLPHMIAAALVNLVLNPGLPRAQGLLCANGFRDTTRIASGSPEMWRDIAVANSRNLQRALGSFARALDQMRRAIGDRDGERVERLLRQAKARRDYWRRMGSSRSPE